MNTLIEKKKRVLLEDEALDWLQLWIVATLLDIKGNISLKNNFVFHANRLVFPNTVTFYVLVLNYVCSLALIL